MLINNNVVYFLTLGFQDMCVRFGDTEKKTTYEQIEQSVQFPQSFGYFHITQDTEKYKITLHIFDSQNAI